MLLDGGISFLLTAILILWLLILTLWIYKTVRHYKKLISGGGTDLATILDRLLVKQSRVETNIKEIGELVAILGSRAQRHIQKVGLVRFSPYGDTGGDQSFALSLLNAEDSGVVILSLHSRDGTRVYIKSIKKGLPEYELSREEKQAVEDAKRGKWLSH